MTDERLPASGEQHTIRAGDHEAVVTGIGAALRSYAVAGRDVLEPFGPDEPPPGGHGQPLMPWPNRVRDGRWRWHDRDLQLPLSEPGAHNASHGLVRWLPWQVADRSDDALTLTTTVGAQPGWPEPLRCTVAVSLATDTGLTVTLGATNLGAGPCPWGAGSHPYLAVPGGVDTAVLRVPAATRLVLDERNLPVGRTGVAGTEQLLDGARPVGTRVLDVAYTDLDRDADGGVTATLDTADGWRTTLRGDASVRWLQVFTGDTLTGAYHRSAIAVEAMTCPPDALNSGQDLVVLAPGASAAMTWSVQAGPRTTG